MTIKELVKQGKMLLNENDFDDSHIIARQLLCKTLEKDNQYILAHQEENINELKSQEFLEYIDQVISGKPVQYITNNQEFLGYDFFVNENVLIPQPDTEIVVQSCIKMCLRLLEDNGTINILDLCTGSGAIAISLDKILNRDDNVKVFASDISKSALEVARINHKNLNSCVQFIESDMFKNISDRYDVIISNPPYISTDIIKNLPIDVQEEPKIALDGGIDGLDFYRIIEKEGVKHLNKGGYLCLEIGFDQAETVKKIFENNYKILNVIKDFENNDRCIIVTTK